MASEAPKCDKCGRSMVFIGDVKPEIISSDGDHFTVPLASAIWECNEHGCWRIYTSGTRVSPGWVVF